VNARDAVRALLATHLEPPADDHAPLVLSSFALVVLVEELEDAFGVRIAAAEVTPENFRSVASILALVHKGMS
jgi:acyl carrier protein